MPLQASNHEASSGIKRIVIKLLFIGGHLPQLKHHI